MLALRRIARVHATLVHLKRIMVNFMDEQWTMLERFRGLLGNTNSEIVKYVARAMVVGRAGLEPATSAA
jgi:hypothetical protein